MSEYGRQGPILEIEDLSLRQGGKTLLEAATLELCSGQSLAIRGRSGTGKTTLLSAILGLFRPDTGTITVNGSEVQAGRRSAARLRRESIGMIFQGGDLLADLTPLENVVIAALLAGQKDGVARLKARELLDLLGVPDRPGLIGSFSGGEQQRVAVARALVNGASLLLADEPTGSLDPESRDRVLELLHRLPEQHSCALVVVTHDPVVAASCDLEMELVNQRLAWREREAVSVE